MRETSIVKRQTVNFSSNKIEQLSTKCIYKRACQDRSRPLANENLYSIFKILSAKEHAEAFLHKKIKAFYYG